MKSLFIILFLLSLTGCGTITKLMPPQIVKVPVMVKCKSTTVVTPITEYPMDNANKDMSLYEKNQLALAELDLVRGQNKELSAALSECVDK